MILALRSCVMVWCAAWYFDSTRCYLHSEVFCFGRGLYSSGCERQPIEVPASGGAQQYVNFRGIHQPFHTVLPCPFGTDSQPQNQFPQRICKYDDVTGVWAHWRSLDVSH